MDGYYKKVAKELAQLGYERQHGGKHQKWVDSSGRVMIVPHNIKSRHTANEIMKNVGSSLKF